jgi:uncharacterized iron-regulated membrane protein
MKDRFRQSMAWLHTWTGLVVGWVLFFVFLTGTFGYVNAEVDLWMRPEQRVVDARESDGRLLLLAQRRLRERAPDAELWQIVLPGRRGSYDFSIYWRAWPAPGKERGASARGTLDPLTGAPSEAKVRETGGGTALYVMHYALHYLPARLAYYLVGICTMSMFIAILTGVIAHKRIFRDFFTFRTSKGQRTWLDAHNLLGVTALPFHLMITWSGLIFFLFTYMPLALDTLYPKGEGRLRFASDVYGVERQIRSPDSVAAELISLASLLPVVEEKWGTGKVERVSVHHAGRANAEVVFRARHVSVKRDRPSLRFDGVTGEFLGDETDGQSGAARFNSVLLALHEGRFAGPVLRFLYVIAGLVGSAMIGTGLLFWSAKRKAKLRKTDKPNFGIAAVDVLNLGTTIGLPFGIAAYFWANRLLPAEMDTRAAWEIHVMFIAWAGSFLYAAARPLDRAWVELCWLAAAAWALLPLLNALTTHRHPGVTILEGDWVFVGFDLSAFATGLFFTGIALVIRRKRHVAARQPRRAQIAVEERGSV